MSERPVRLRFPVTWASLAEGRPPLPAELEAIAAKIWRDAYSADALLDWDEIEVGSLYHRRTVAAARAALGVGTLRVGEREAA